MGGGDEMPGGEGRVWIGDGGKGRLVGNFILTSCQPHGIG